MINKQKLPLIIALAVPALMIIAVALSIYIPVLSAHPQHDFIYMNSDYYYANNIEYYVQNEKLMRRELPASPDYPKAPVMVAPEPKLYYHDTSENKSREITLEEAQKYNLDSNTVSPDGYEVSRGGGGGFFPFFYDGNYNTFYLKGHRVGKKLNLQQVGGYYNFRFLGWTK